MKKFVLAGIGGAFIALLISSATNAAFYSLFGGATLVSPGNDSNTAVSLVSDNLTSAPDVSQVFLEVPAGLTFGQLATLSLDYNVTNDGCFGDSPRFSFSMDVGDDGVDGFMDVYIAPPGFSGCPAGWQTSGNLIGMNDVGRYVVHDVGGQHTPGNYSDMMAAYSDAVVTGYFQLIVDGGYQSSHWGDSDQEQEILVDNVNINGQIYTFEPETPPPPSEAPACKNGGWQSLAQSDGTPFKNQGECLRYFHTGK